MTAFDLIADIFRRPQQHTDANVRHITRAQLNYLRDLISNEGPDEAIGNDGPGRLIWSPMGRTKYIVAEDLRGNRHTLTRLMTITPTDAGRLF